MSKNQSVQRFFGIDLAKRESQLCVLDQSGECLQRKRFASTLSEFGKIAADLTEHDTVAFEMTTNAFSIARLFLARSKARVIVSNPILTKLIAASKNKTDKIDAFKLADLARVGYLPEVWLPDERTESMRRLVSRRSNLVGRRTAVKNDIHSILHRNLINYQTSDLFSASGLETLRAIDLPSLESLLVDDYLDEISELNRRIERSEQTIAAFICADDQLLAQMDLLLTIEGISLVTAAGILSAIGDISRFSSPEKLASYFGLTPSNYQSGELKTYHGRITKQGRAEARWFLSEAAESLIRSPSPLTALYKRVFRKKGHNVAKTAVARKMAELIWHILTKQTPYLYQKHRLTQEKQSRLRHLGKQIGIETRSASPTERRAEKAIRGLGLKFEGRNLKNEISRTAVKRSVEIYEAVLGGRQKKAAIRGFNPFKPTQHDYERLLREVIREILPEKLEGAKT
jgi:transposase